MKLKRPIDTKLMLMLKSMQMKLTSTTSVSKGIATKSMVVAVAVMMVLATPLAVTLPAFADKYDDQINALQQEINGYEARASELGKQAKTLQNELDSLAIQKATIQGQIDISQAKHDKLISDIAKTEKKIADNKSALGTILADMYVADSVSPLEMLASSKNIGDYVDQQQYRSSIKDSLRNTIKQISELKKTLESQKTDVERVLADQNSQRDQLASKEAESANLLAQTQGQESAYQQLMSQRNAQINSLRDQQAAEMRAQNPGSIGNGTIGGGGYPGIWAFAEQDTLVDKWGLYNRECVSYTAWKVWSTGRYVPHFGGQGNANQWPSTTSRYGIPNGSNPVKGSVAIWYIGQYGHTMYVEDVYDNGTILVSDYNNNSDGGGWGKYHMYVRSSAGLTYIYF